MGVGRGRVLVVAALFGAGCGVTPAEPPREPLPVPFAVSDHYSPDGFFGDGETRGAVDLTKECPPRAPGATGDCYTVTYRPGAKGFAGVVWQYPHNNWGFWPGHAIAPGAARITLLARGGRGGETITFGGGQRDSPNAHRDSFKLDEVTVGLQPQWTRHEIPFGGESYLGPSGVIGPFLFSLAAGTGREPIVIHLDDIRWTP